MPNLSPKQLEVYNCYKRYLLVSGPRKSGKTWASLERISRHIWETNHGCVALFSKTVKASKEGGVWKALTEIVWPKWFEAGIGFKYVKSPMQDGQTRTMFCKIANMHGNYTTVYLNSLEHVNQAEDKLKERVFSMVYFSELSKFKDRNVFTHAAETLRMPHLDYDDHMFLADTNPADEGEDSWIWKLWFEERRRVDHEDPDFQNDLQLIEIMMTENPFLSQRALMDVIAKYRHDPDQYARYVEGKWVRASRDAFFSLNFKPVEHVVGNIMPKREEDWEIILPHESCTTLYCGWDIGDKNPALSLMQKRTIETEPSKPLNVYDVLDELVVNNQEVGLRDFVEEVMELMVKWETFLGRPLQWVHWSDTSSFGHKIIADATEALRVLQFSEGAIQLQGAYKKAGSQRKRVDLTNRLLFENRIHFSANCVKHIEMMKVLRRGPNQGQYIADIDAKDIFDAFSYVLISEEPKDLALAAYPRVGKRAPQIVEV